jgi:hypothetical protein
VSVPQGYKTIEEIAVELKVPLGRVQAAVNALGIVQKVFPPDRRRRYYAPEDIEKITEWARNR